MWTIIYSALSSPTLHTRDTSIPSCYNLVAPIPFPLTSPHGNVRASPQPGRLEVCPHLNSFRQTTFPKQRIDSPQRAGQKESPFLGCKFTLWALLPAELSFWSPSGSLESQVPWTKGDVYLLAPTRRPPLHCLGTCLKNSGPPEPGTTFMGSEVIMSFYELWGP